MESTLKILRAHQLPSGQFPTSVINETENIREDVHTIAPTYLICTILDEVRDRGHSHPFLDDIIWKGAEFLLRMCYLDPITRLRVWHFNAFYPPDWEETSSSACLLYKLGFITKDKLIPLRNLAQANETHDRGIGVWLKDLYSKNNCYNNVFDPVVSLAVSRFLYRIFGEHSEPTENFISRTIKSKQGSLYYAYYFMDFLFFLLGGEEKPNTLGYEKLRLFHHCGRTNIWYASPDVWETAEMAMVAL